MYNGTVRIVAVLNRACIVGRSGNAAAILITVGALYSAGIAAILHRCIICKSDNAAGRVVAGHCAGVETALHRCAICVRGNAAEVVIAAHVHGVAVGTAGNLAPYDITAHGANISVTVKGRFLHGNVLYGSADCIADQTDMICIWFRTGQPADGVTVAVKCACKSLASEIFANGRPLGAVHGETRRQAGVDVGSAVVVYLVGKPAQLPLVVDFVIVAVQRCLLPCTATAANAVFRVVVVQCLLRRVAVACGAGGGLVYLVAVQHGEGLLTSPGQGLTPNGGGGVGALAVLQQVRHLAAVKLCFRFGGRVCAGIVGKVVTVKEGGIRRSKSANRVCNGTVRIVAVFNRACTVGRSGNAAAIPTIVGSRYSTGIAAILHRCSYCLSDNAADWGSIAGHCAGVETALHRCTMCLSDNAAEEAIAAHGAAVGTAGDICIAHYVANNAAAVFVTNDSFDRVAVGNGAACEITAHGANMISTVKGGSLHGDVLYGSVDCIADQTDMIFICVRAGQLADGVTVALKRACKRDGICANGRPLGAVHGDVFHQAGVDVGSVLVVYLVGKPAQLPLVVNFVIVAVQRCLLPCTAAYANVVFIIILVFVKCLSGRIAVPLAGGILCRFVNHVSRSAVKHRVVVCFARAVDTLPPNLRGAAKVFLQLVRHIAVLELEFGFGFASFGSVFASIANSFLTCPRKVIALFHSAAAVPAAHAADRIIADNLTGVIASLHSATHVLTAHAADEVTCAGNLAGVIASIHSAVGVVLTAHAADIRCAGNLAGVIAFLQGAVVIAAHAAGAIIFAGNLAGVIAFLQGVAFVIAAHAADIRCAGNRTGVVAVL